MQTPYRGLNWDDEWKGNITKYSNTDAIIL